MLNEIIEITLTTRGRRPKDRFNFGDDATIGKQLMTVDKGPQDDSNQAFGVFMGRINGKYCVALYDGLSWDLSGKFLEYETAEAMKAVWQLD